MASNEIFEFRGVDNFHFAEIIRDDSDGFVCSAPIHIPVQEIGKSVDASSEAHYYDNKAMIVVNSESADTISLILAPPSLDILAKLIGKSFDESTGMMIDSPRKNKYFAISYRTKGTDGEYRYVTRLKGTFSIPEESNKTEDDSSDTSNTEIEFTGIYTEHEFDKGIYDGTNWIKSGVKGIVVDSRYALADVSNFFESIQTPDSVSSSPSIGTINITMSAGSSTGKTQVDVIYPNSEIGNKYVYKLGSDAEDVSYNDALTTGWTQLTLDTDISASSGQVITVAEVNKVDSKAKKVGSAEVVLPE